MSSLKQRFLSGLLTFVMVFTFTLSVSAASFTDVKQGDWYYETITEMTEKGLFNGKGNNLFCPDDTMTKAEFLAVAIRIVHPDTDFTATEGQKWWQPVYNKAVTEIITEKEFPSNSIEQTINRQEMSLIAIRVLMKIGQLNSMSFDTDLENKIPDFYEIDSEYRTWVKAAYTIGILCGTDAQGTFAPKDTLTRAEASTVLYRIVESDARTPNKDLYSSNNNGGGTNYQYAENTASPITIEEGKVTLRRLAKEGDTVIKADGTSVVLKKGPNGILGEGQGVAADLGATTISGYPLQYTVTDYNKVKVSFASAIYFEDSTGTEVANQKYFVNGITGEGHWAKEWEAVVKNSKPIVEGKFGYQLSEDKNFYWSAGGGDWAPIYSNSSDKLINNIRQANGL